VALTYIEHFARTQARLLCDDIQVDYSQPEALIRVTFGDRMHCEPVDVASNEGTLCAVERAVYAVLGLRRSEPPPLPQPPETVIIQNADGYRARLVAPSGAEADLWDPQQWQGSYRIQHDLNGRSRFYEFVQLPSDANGTRVFGWLEIPELPRLGGE